MAQSDPIKHDQIIEDGVFNPTIENAKLLDETLKGVVITLKEFAIIAGKKMNYFDATTPEGVEAINNQYQKTNVLLGAYTEASQRSAKATAALTIEQQKIKIAITESNRESKVEAQLMLAKKGSYNDLTAQLIKLDIQYRNINLSSKELTVQEKAVISNRAVLKQQLIDLDATQNVYTRNVGNYTGAYQKLGKGIGGLTELIGTLGGALGIDTSLFKTFESVGRTLITTTKELGHSTEIAEVQEKFYGEAVDKSTESELAHNEAMTIGIAKTEEKVTANEAEVASTVNIAEAIETQNAELVTEAAVTDTATASQWSLNAAMDANPIGALVIGLVALGGVLYGITKLMDSFADSTDSADVAINKQISDLAILKAGQKGVNDAMEANGDSSEKINAQNLSDLNKQIFALQQIYDAQKKASDEEFARGKNAKVEGADSHLVDDPEIIAKAQAKKNEADKTYAELQKLIYKQTIAEIKVNKDNATETARNYEEEHKAFLKKIEDADNELKKEDKALDNSKKREKQLNKEYEARQKNALDIVDLLEKQNELEDGFAEDSKTPEEKKIKKIEKFETDAIDNARKLLEEGFYDEQEYNAAVIKIRKEAGDAILELKQEELAKENELEQKHIFDLVQKENDLNEELKTSKEQVIDKIVDKRNEEATLAQQLLDEGIISQQEYADYIIAIDKKMNRDLAEDAIKTQVKVAEEITKGISEGLETQTKLKEDALKSQTSLIDSETKTQEELFADGLKNNLAFEEKQRADAAVKEVKLAKQLAKEKGAVELGNLFLKLAEANAKDGAAGIRDALNETLLAKGIQAGISGVAYDGVEDIGSGGGLDSRGGELWMLHPHESVIKGKATMENPGLATAWNNGQLDQYFSDVYLPQFMGSLQTDDVSIKTDHQMIGLLSLKSELQEIKNVIKNKREYSVTVDDQKRIVEIITENGNKKIITNRFS